MPQIVRTEHPHIVKIPGVLGGKPVIAGTRIGVNLIARLLRAGDDPTDILASYPHLSATAVYDAISYYFDHRLEIDREIDELTPERVAEKLNFLIGDNGKIIFKDL